MAQKFLTNVELEAGLVDGSNSTGTSGYLLSSTGTATSWVDPAAVSVGESEQVHIACKNTSGVAISKGDPVYITGTVGTSFKIEIAKADASDSAKMPAVGLAETDLGLNAEGFVIVSGVLKNLTTDPLSTSDGTPSSNDTVYVKAGGGLTKTKPTGSGNLIQNVGKVGRVSSANAGSLAVSTIMRTNDVPNLTTGKIWVGSSTYTTESTVVHLDETNKRVGIGTSSPAAKLHIGPTTVGTTVEELRIQTGTSSGFGGTAVVNLLTGQYGGSGIYFGDQATYSNQPASIEYQDSPTTLTFKVPGTSGRQFFKIGNTEAMRIDYNSNVGIGTTSPSSKLQVNGDLTVGDDATVGSFINVIAAGSNQDAGIRFGTESNTDSKAAIYTNTSNSDLHFDVTESTRMLIDSGSGNVGIGTTSPTARLDVTYSGIGAKIHSAQSIGLQVSGGGNSQDIARFQNVSGTTKVTINHAGDVGIGTTSPVDKLDVRGTARITSPQANDWIVLAQNYATGAPSGFWDSNGNVHLYLRDSSSNTNVLIKSDSSSYFNGGNVGIGTSSPGAKLDVVSGDIRLGTNATYFRVRDTASAQPRVLGMNASNNFYIGPIDSYAGGSMIYGTSGNMQHHRFYIAGSEQVRITSGGNVGIGTTNPGYKLDVAGDLRVDNGNLGSTSGDEVEHVKIQGGRHFVKFKEVRTANDTDWRNTTFKIQSGVDSTNHQSIDFVADSSYNEHIDILTGNQVFNTRFTSSGNVGIGLTGPSTKLHVLGTSSSMPSLGAAPTAAQIGGSSYGTLFSTLTSGRGVIQQGRVDGAATSYDLLLQPVGGNVAIGKTSAGVKLDVAGDVRVNGLDNFLYTTSTNDIYTFGSSTQTMANAPNGYLWHDLLAFNYVYTTTQEVTSDGTNWSSTTLQKNLFAQKEGQAITVIGSTQTGVRWTFNNTAWGSAVLLNVAFTYVASDINKNILVESSSNGTSWTTRFTNTATAGTSTKTCKLTSYGGDAYVRVTITKAVSSSNLVRMSQLRLMTLRAGDQGYGREYHSPITWDGDRNIGIKLASPTTSISEALEVNGSVKATADTDAYKGYIKSIITTGYSMKSASTAYHYIPYNSYLLTTSQAYYNRTVAAYNGRVKKIIVKRIDGASADATGLKFKKEINGIVIATEYTATVLSGSGNFQATYNFANSDFTFSAGDSIGVLMQSSGGTGMIGAGAIQIVLEYNIT